MSKIIPIKENENKGFHYTVTDEQIRIHQNRSVQEIFEWLESTSRFVYNLQTPEEKERSRSVKNNP